MAPLMIIAVKDSNGQVHSRKEPGVETIRNDFRIIYPLLKVMLIGWRYSMSMIDNNDKREE